MFAILYTFYFCVSIKMHALHFFIPYHDVFKTTLINQASLNNASFCSWTLCNKKCDKWVIVRLSIYLTLLLKHQLRSEHGPKYLLSLLGNASAAIVRYNLAHKEKMYK